MLQCSSYAQTALFLFLGDLEKAWGEKQWLSDIQMTSLSASPHVPEEKYFIPTISKRRLNKGSSSHAFK